MKFQQAALKLLCLLRVPHRQDQLCALCEKLPRSGSAEAAGGAGKKDAFAAEHPHTTPPFGFGCYSRLIIYEETESVKKSV
jgi:hypothetical protein